VGRARCAACWLAKGCFPGRAGGPRRACGWRAKGVGAPGGENGWQGRKALWKKRKRRCPDRQALRAVLAGRGQALDLKEVL